MAESPSNAKSIVGSPSQISASSSADGDLSGPDTTPLTSTPPSECSLIETNPEVFRSWNTESGPLSGLFAENIVAKALRTAQTALEALPNAFPEYVPQEGGRDGSYVLREAEFWTCGFFPGTLYAILERFIRFPHSLNLPDDIDITDLRSQLSALCRIWSEPLHGMAGRTDTHDIGFIVMPALRADWELNNNSRSLDSIVRAAKSLATRYVPSAKAIRSWNLLKKKDIEILDQKDNMIVIIDSLCNLDLLYYASHHTRDRKLADIATAHAATVLQSHLRPEIRTHTSKTSYEGQWYSACHVANLDPQTGVLKRRLTAQGYSHESTWARGQAWGILGYAQTYMWTKDRRFLEASCGLAEYFLHRLDTAPSSVRQGRYVPLWDFDAPIENTEIPLRDSSAGIIAANGMLVLSQALTSIDKQPLASQVRNAAIALVQDALSFALAPEKARLANGPYRHIHTLDAVPSHHFDAILKFGTANNNENARKRYANHGLVYGDYYLVEFGNRLLNMGLE